MSARRSSGEDWKEQAVMVCALIADAKTYLVETLAVGTGVGGINPEPGGSTARNETW